MNVLNVKMDIYSRIEGALEVVYRIVYNIIMIRIHLLKIAQYVKMDFTQLVLLVNRDLLKIVKCMPLLIYVNSV